MPELRNDLLYSENCFATYQISNAKIINTGFSWQNLKVYFFQLGMTFHGMGLQRMSYDAVYFPLIILMLLFQSLISSIYTLHSDNDHAER